MALKFEELRVLQTAETIADDVWNEVMRWDAFAREIVGGQFIRASDSIGANIAEAFGRFHYGEKLQFLYYARGSIYESKYWLNRSRTRGLLSSDRAEALAAALAKVARQLNAFSQMIRKNRGQNSPGVLREPVLSMVRLCKRQRKHFSRKMI